MDSNEKEMSIALLDEERMTNGEYNNNNNTIVLKQTQPEENIVTTNGLSWRDWYFIFYVGVCLFLTIAAYILVFVDAMLRLGLPTFGVLLFFLPIFVSSFNALALKPNKVPPVMDGERVFGEIIQSYWAPAEEQAKVERCHFIVHYTFDGITYQQKYCDNTWGLIATEKYVELIVSKSNPKEPLLAVNVDSLYRHSQDTGTIIGFLKDAFSWLMTLFLFLFVALPLLAIPLECNTIDKGCTPIVWMDAILHYIFVLGLSTLFLPYVGDQKKIIPSVATEKVEKPFVLEAEDSVVDHSLFQYPSPSSHSLYQTTSFVSFVLSVLYFTVNSEIIDLSYIVTALSFPAIFCLQLWLLSL